MKMKDKGWKAVKYVELYYDFRNNKKAEKP